MSESGSRLRWWDIAVAGVAVLMLFPSAMSPVEWSQAGWHAEFVLSIGVIAAFVVLYVLLGRPALRRANLEQAGQAASVEQAASVGQAEQAGQPVPPEQPEPSLQPRDFVYVVLVAALLGLACSIAPSFATLQVLAYPMAWTIIERYRDAVMMSALIAVGVGLGSALAYHRDGFAFGIETALFTALASFVFAVAMGTWITRIFNRGEQYRVMAEQLRAAQSQVTALSIEAGAAAERERLSRELHDTLTQTLTGLVMLSEQASRALDADEVGRARDRLERVSEAAREAVSEARALVATTQPLGDGGLHQVLRRVARRLEEDSGLIVTVELEEIEDLGDLEGLNESVELDELDELDESAELAERSPVQLSREYEVVLLRAAQEGLANARKHARAAHAAVRLRLTETHVVLEVEDDGVGIKSAHASPVTGLAGPAATEDIGELSGFGLSGLADRVRLVAGDTEVGPGTDGRGTLLRVRLPLEGSPDATLSGRERDRG